MADNSKSRGRARGRARLTDQQFLQHPGPPRITVQQPQSAWNASTNERNGQGLQASSVDLGQEAVNNLTNVFKTVDLDSRNNPASSQIKRETRDITYDTTTTRPVDLKTKKGTSGKQIKLTTNYFELMTKMDWRLYQYRVDFAPDENRTQVRKHLLAQACRDKLPGYIFDGSVLFTSHRINSDVLEVVSELPGNTDNIKITLRLVGEVKNGDYHLLQFFNIVVRKCLNYMKLQIVGRNYYDAAAKIKIPQYEIELWPGYITSIRQHESKILLCCEISHKFMRNENVLQILNYCRDKNRENFKGIFEKLIVGCIVLTDYNNRTYRVDDVLWNVSPQSKFSKNDGSSISYLDYYKKRYQINIIQNEQPMLLSRAKPRELRAGMSELIFLVPELCRMTGLTDAERLNMQMMRTLAEHMRLEPNDRIQRLNTFSHRMSSPEITNELKKWDMTLAPKLVEFSGRVLPPETIIQGKCNAKYSVGDDNDWTRSMRAKPMIMLGKIKCWVVISASTIIRDVPSFVQVLRKAAVSMSLNFPEPSLLEIPDDRPTSYLTGLNNAIAQYNPSLIMCVVTNNKADRYNAIKKKCCVDRAVPVQVILKKNLVHKGVLSIATKVAIQINCKLGGAPWTVEIPIPNLMVVGFDVSHDTMNKSKSYGAMVASLDRQATRYFSAVSAHTNGEELSNDFSLNILKAIKRFQEVNDGQVPDRIVIYRDGVGDGQLPYVLHHEVECIKNALSQYYKEKPVKMAFVVVTKRINTRLFAYNNRNAPPGTVVDDVITIPQRYDFFIVSQNVRQGTVSPISYNVIYDTARLDPDKIQRLTYKLTFLYYNWTGTIRVPAPCQYAHKLAFLVSKSLHRDPNPQLDNTLYFL